MDRAADVVIGATFDKSFNTVINSTQKKIKKLGSGLNDALGRTRLDTPNLKKLNQSLTRSIDATKRYRSEMRSGVTDTVALGASLYASLAPSVKFEQMQNRIADATNASSEEMAALTKLAKEQGRTTAFSAVQSAAAIEMLAKNGLATADILGGALTGSMQLAAATGADLSMAADLATDVMANFGKEASELTAVNDGLVGTLKASKFDINDYRRAIAQAGGVAGSLGVSLDDFNVALAATSSQFASGADAGTSFKTFLQRLVPASKEAANMMDRYGLEFFDANGQMKDMASISEELREGLSGLSDAELTDAMSTLFGTDAMRTAVGLMRQGQEGIEATALKIAEGGDAAAAAEARMKGFRGAIVRMQSALEGVAVTVGTLLLPTLTNIVDYIIPVINKISELAETYPQVTKAVTGAVAAFAALKVATFSVGYGFSFIKEGAIRAGRATVATADVATNKNWTGIAGRIVEVGAAFGVVEKGGKAAVKAIKGWKIKALLGKFKLVSAALFPMGATMIAVTAAVIALATSIYKYWEPLVNFFSGVWQGISSVFAEMGSGITQGLEPLTTALEPIKPLFDAIGSAIGSVINWFSNLLTPITQTEEEMQATVGAGVAVGRVIGAVLVGAIEVLLTPLKVVIWYFQTMTSALSNVYEWFSTLGSRISAFGGELLQVFNEDGFIAAGRALMNGLWTGMRSIFTKVANWVSSRIAALVDLMPEWLTDVMGIKRQERVLTEIEIDQQVSERLEGLKEDKFEEGNIRRQAEGFAKSKYEDDSQTVFGSYASAKVEAQREAFVNAAVEHAKQKHRLAVQTKREAEEARIRTELINKNNAIFEARQEKITAVIGKEPSTPLTAIPAVGATGAQRPALLSKPAVLAPAMSMAGSAPSPKAFADTSVAVADTYREGAHVLDNAMSQAISLESAREAALSAERPRSVVANVQAPITVNNYGPADAGGTAVRNGVYQGANDILAAERDAYLD